MGVLFGGFFVGGERFTPFEELLQAEISYQEELRYINGIFTHYFYDLRFNNNPAAEKYISQSCLGRSAPILSKRYMRNYAYRMAQIFLDFHPAAPSDFSAVSPHAPQAIYQQHKNRKGQADSVRNLDLDHGPRGASWLRKRLSFLFVF